MRLAEIRRRRAALGQLVPQLSPVDISDRIGSSFSLVPHEPLRRRLARAGSPHALRLLEPKARRRLGLTPSFPYHRLCVGERLASDLSRASLLRAIRHDSIDHVLVPGCYTAAEDIQFWLRRGVKRVEGIDVYSLAKVWRHAVPELRAQYGADVRFQQAAVEAIPFEDESFDLIASAAVLEHVQNIAFMAAETARVLRPGGWAWHDFGPLYFSYGADHCIAAYGHSHGYDHLLLEEPDYQARIRDQEFFDGHDDPNLPFWALHDQFSFARASEYMEVFSRYFDIHHVVVKVSEEGVAFRDAYPGQWAALLNAGIGEEDLLVKSLCVLLKKRARCTDALDSPVRMSGSPVVAEHARGIVPPRVPEGRR